jgi:hypothetical protein
VKLILIKPYKYDLKCWKLNFKLILSFFKAKVLSHYCFLNSVHKYEELCLPELPDTKSIASRTTSRILESELSLSSCPNRTPPSDIRPTVKCTENKVNINKQCFPTGGSSVFTLIATNPKLYYSTILQIVFVSSVSV